MAASALRVACLGLALVLGVLAIWAAARELPDFWDPCMEWGQQSGEGLSLEADDGACGHGKSGTSETKVEAATRMAAVFGVVILASVLAAIGAWRTSSWPMLVAAFLLFAETVLLFFGLSIAFPLTLAGAIVFLVAGLRWRRYRPDQPAQPS